MVSKRLRAISIQAGLAFSSQALAVGMPLPYLLDDSGLKLGMLLGTKIVLTCLLWPINLRWALVFAGASLVLEATAMIGIELLCYSALSISQSRWIPLLIFPPILASLYRLAWRNKGLRWMPALVLCLPLPVLAAVIYLT